MTARAAFKQDDVARACKGVKAAGLAVARVVVVDGRIEVIVGDPESEHEPTGDRGALDKAIEDDETA